jgi:Mg-chelatase subunit ChlD
MMLLLAVALPLAALGLSLVASARPVARWALWCLLLAGAAVVLSDPERVWQAHSDVPAVVPLRGDAAAMRTALLAAGAAAAPAAEDLVVRWQQPLPQPSPLARFGATAEVLAPLPFAPAQLQLRALAPAAVGRPLALQFDPLPIDEPVAGELRLRRGDRQVFAMRVELGRSSPPLAAFVPDAAGDHLVELELSVRGHRLLARGELPVGEAPDVLVLEPTGRIAAALQAQGIAVTRAAEPPAEWRRHAAVVIGQPLPVAAQQELVAAVLDGVGALVLEPGFGGDGAPMRALLPVRPLPPAPATAAGNGSGGSQPGPIAPPSAEPPPPVAPPKPPPIDPRPPRGDTEGAGPVGAEPIEVDKHAIAMVLVVDRSGSMGNLVGASGRTKMSYAKSSALQTARALGAGDQVGLVTFGNKDAGRVELPLSDATASAAVRAGIEALAHGPEQTFLLSGLRLAHDQLRDSPAAVKHVVVISDGEFFVTEEIALRAEASRMRGSRITLSVISIVDAFTDSAFKKLAEELTRDGGGEFLPTDDPSTVPVFVSAEVTRALRRVGRKPRAGDGAEPDVAANQPQPPKPRQPDPPPVEPPPPALPPPEPTAARVLVRQIADSALLLPAPFGDWPTLAAALPTEAPLDAHVLLVAGDDGWPLLAFGNRGLGRTAAFAADLAGPAGDEFRREPSFPARLAQWVQSLLPPLPLTNPQPLLREITVTPVAVLPDDVQALAALAGTAPREVDAEALSAPPPARSQWQAESRGRAAALAPWLLLGLVAVACLERWSAQRALRRGIGT